MIPNIGPLEIAIVLIIALVVFGPKRLPDLGRSIGSGINEFKEGLSSISVADEQDDDEGQDEPAEIGAGVDEDPEVAEIHRGDPVAKAESVNGEVVAELKE